MPTGYTACIESDASFKEFVFRCARAFGACMDMRDDDPSIPPHTTVKASPYHYQSLQRDKKRLAMLQKMPLSVAKVKARKDYQEKAKRAAQYALNQRDLKAKYDKMAEQVRAWKTPASLGNLKEFMLKQIEESVRFDISDSDNIPVEKSAKEWKKDQIASAKWDVAYHQKHWKQEQDRIKKTNKWLADLYKSLPSS